MGFDFGSALSGGLSGFMMTGNPFVGLGMGVLGGIAGGKKKKAEEERQKALSQYGQTSPEMKNLISMYKDTAEGRNLLGPSMYKQARADISSGMNAALAGQRGLSRGMAARSSAQAAATMGRGAAFDSAKLAASERDTARANLGSLLSGRDANIRAGQLSAAEAKYDYDVERSQMLGKSITAGLQSPFMQGKLNQWNKKKSIYGEHAPSMSLS
jgi:hypothetical protein